MSLGGFSYAEGGFVPVFLAGPDAAGLSLDAAVARKCSSSSVNLEMLMLSVPFSSFILLPTFILKLAQELF